MQILDSSFNYLLSMHSYSIKTSFLKLFVIKTIHVVVQKLCKIFNMIGPLLFLERDNRKKFNNVAKKKGLRIKVTNKVLDKVITYFS